MWNIRATVALASLACLFVTRSPALEVHETLRAEYFRARAVLAAKYAGSSGAGDDAGLGAALDRAWTAVAGWAAGFLEEHPDATAAQLAKAVEGLDPVRPCGKSDERCFEEYHLEANAVRLNGSPGTTFAVAVNYPHSGTFFVIARGSDGHFRPRWNIKEIARKHFLSRDEIGYWAWTGSGWGDGPARGVVGPLPRAGSGRPRFYVAAVAATEAGGTFRNQFSVWEWTGIEARSLFIESYMVSFDTEPLTVKGGDLSIPTKGSYKSFFTCGSCAEPHVLRSLRVAADGVHDLGTIDGEPELRCADELWDRLIRGRPAGGLASPEVIETLRPIVQDVLRESGVDLEHSLGMLNDANVTEENGHRFLLLKADNLDCRELRFELESANGGRCFRAVRVQNPCGGRAEG